MAITTKSINYKYIYLGMIVSTCILSAKIEQLSLPLNFTVLSQNRMEGIYYRNANQSINLCFYDDDISPTYQRSDEHPLIFYKKNPKPSVIGKIVLPRKQSNNWILLFIKNEEPTNSNLPYRIIPIQRSSLNLLTSHLTFINTTTVPLACKINNNKPAIIQPGLNKPIRIPTGKLTLSTIGNFENILRQAFVRQFSSKAKSKTLVIIYPPILKGSPQLIPKFIQL